MLIIQPAIGVTFTKQRFNSRLFKYTQTTPLMNVFVAPGNKRQSYESLPTPHKEKPINHYTQEVF